MYFIFLIKIKVKNIFTFKENKNVCVCYQQLIGNKD